MPTSRPASPAVSGVSVSEYKPKLSNLMYRAPLDIVLVYEMRSIYVPSSSSIEDVALKCFISIGVTSASALVLIACATATPDCAFVLLALKVCSTVIFPPVPPPPCAIALSTSVLV